MGQTFTYESRATGGIKYVKGEASAERIFDVSVADTISESADQQKAAALISAMLSYPTTTAYPLPTGRTWPLMYPIAYDIEMKKRDTFVLRIAYSSNNDRTARAAWTTGSISLETDEDRAGNKLIEMLSFTMPAAMLHIEQTFPWVQFFGQSLGVGTKLYIVKNLLGKVNQDVFADCNPGQVMFAGFDVEETPILNDSDGARCKFHFAHANFKLLSENVRWQLRDSQGDLHDVREQDNFSQLGLTWSNGTTIAGY